MNLNKINILVTRPAHQAEHLCQLIAAQGGQPVRLPVIEIAEIEDKSSLLTCRARLNEVDIAIFISANAVEKTLPTLLNHEMSSSLLKSSLLKKETPHFDKEERRGILGAHSSELGNLQIIAVGKRTAKTLKNWGLMALCPASPFNSEAMLEMPQMQTEQVQGKKVVIFRGEGGRELLAETLRQRGAEVNYINVYRRVQPPLPAWFADSQIDIMTITSVEGLHNLWAMLKGQSWLRHTPFVVMSERIRMQAQQLGIQAQILVAPTASDEGLLEALLRIGKSVEKPKKI
jgi:uroporphyrinogen-III synthase